MANVAMATVIGHTIGQTSHLPQFLAHLTLSAVLGKHHNGHTTLQKLALTSFFCTPSNCQGTLQTTHVTLQPPIMSPLGGGQPVPPCGRGGQ